MWALIPIRLEYPSGWMGWVFFGTFALVVALTVWMGMRSLTGLGPVRKWVALGMRLLVLLLIFLILGNIRWQREHKDLSVMVLRDISDSTSLVRNYPASARTLQAALEDYLSKASAAPYKPASDRIGVVAFSTNALIEAMPNTTLALDAAPIRQGGGGTDVASGIQLALASMGNDTMRRLVLVWDGNATTGKLDEAIASAVAQHVPIDVIPLRYQVTNEVLVERYVSPTWKRENEPFTQDVILRSTNSKTVRGKLTVTRGAEAMDLDPAHPGVKTRIVELKPGLNVEHVRVPPLKEAGVHPFKAIFEPEGGADTLLSNNTADAFTFVKGQGKVLYIDNYAEGAGDILRQALVREKIELDANLTRVEQFPSDLMTLQNYDAVILGNVPLGAGGLSIEQDKLLASAVQNMGVGLVMIGGDQAFGAGGWQGSEVEKVLPLNMDIQAQRQIPKGALVMIVHACEMPDGNKWGEQCAIKAVEALSAYDEVGVISYAWKGGGGGAGGSIWDFPLQTKGDGSKAVAAIKQMQVGDMGSFEDSMNVALNGDGKSPGLAASTAKQKHVIIISDGDPAGPSQGLMDQYKKNKVTVSTVAVYPHSARAMDYIAKELGGKAYGPINDHPDQLPQIFIKEATIVRRNLISEDPNGIPVTLDDKSLSDVVKGISSFPAVRGLVLTSRKNNPSIEVPLAAGKNHDPLLAHWPIGLGKTLAFTSDPTGKWSPQWAGSEMYDKFWAQAVRSVSRPPMSTDADVQTTLDGTKLKVTVEALNKEGGHKNFLRIEGAYLDPEFNQHEIRLVQTAPGIYQGEVDLAAAGAAGASGKAEGNYVVQLNYTDPDGGRGVLRSGVAFNGSLELRDLTSNEARVEEVARRTGGRVIEAFNDRGVDVEGSQLFAREWIDANGTPVKLFRSASPLPVWDKLIPWLLALVLLDVAIRRIAWDWESTKRMAYKTADMVRGFTLARQQAEPRQTLDALKRVREEVAETKFRTDETAGTQPALKGTPPPMPSASAKFEAKDTKGVEGDISSVVGGATDKPVPPPPKKIEPKGGIGAHTGSLLEAKRRAQQKIREKEKEE